MSQCIKCSGRVGPRPFFGPPEDGAPPLRPGAVPHGSWSFAWMLTSYRANCNPRRWLASSLRPRKHSMRSSWPFLGRLTSTSRYDACHRLLISRQKLILPSRATPFCVSSTFRGCLLCRSVSEAFRPSLLSGFVLDTCSVESQPAFLECGKALSTVAALTSQRNHAPQAASRPGATEEDISLGELSSRLSVLARRCRAISTPAFLAFCLEATRTLEAERCNAEGVPTEEAPRNLKSHLYRSLRTTDRHH